MFIISYAYECAWIYLYKLVNVLSPTDSVCHFFPFSVCCSETSSWWANVCFSLYHLASGDHIFISMCQSKMKGGSQNQVPPAHVSKTVHWYQTTHFYLGKAPAPTTVVLCCDLLHCSFIFELLLLALKFFRFSIHKYHFSIFSLFTHFCIQLIFCHPKRNYYIFY